MWPSRGRRVYNTPGWRLKTGNFDRGRFRCRANVSKMTIDLLPLPDAFERLESANLRLTESSWELWVARGLIDRAQRIAGTNDYGLDHEQWRRLKLFASIHNQLDGRPSPEAIAYYTAFWGIDVTPNLVAAYIAKSIRSYYKAMRRRIVKQSNGRLDPRMMQESDARKLGKKIASETMQGLPRIRNMAKRTLLKQTLETLFFVLVCITYEIEPDRSIPGALRNLANGLFKSEMVPVGATFLRKALDSERRRLVDPEAGENQIIEDLGKMIHECPELILRGCNDSRLLLSGSAKGFGFDKTPPPEPSPSAAQMFRLARPFISGLLISFNYENPKSKFLTFIRRDEGGAVEEQARRMDRIAMWHARKLGARP
jgi:hypothetical protein